MFIKNFLLGINTMLKNMRTILLLSVMVVSLSAQQQPSAQEIEMAYQQAKMELSQGKDMMSMQATERGKSIVLMSLLGVLSYPKIFGLIKSGTDIVFAESGSANLWTQRTLKALFVSLLSSFAIYDLVQIRAVLKQLFDIKENEKFLDSQYNEIKRRQQLVRKPGGRQQEPKPVAPVVIEPSEDETVAAGE
jgi:hypothetical protein